MESTPKSLADFLRVSDPRPDAESSGRDSVAQSASTVDTLLNITDPSDFCKKILETREFRQYIVNGIVLGDLPSAVLTRVMDHAWGKPPDKLEVTGKNGGPIAVTEVRRVLVRPEKKHTLADKFEHDTRADATSRTH